MSQIDYVLTRKSVKNINLRILRDGTVAVSAHPNVPRQHIDAFVASKAQWIEAAQQTFVKTTPTPQVYATGAPFPFQGHALTIHLLQGTPEGVVRLQNTLLITTKDTTHQDHIARLVVQFQREQCQALCLPMVQHWQGQLAPYGVAFPHVRFRAMRSQWGSCLYKKNIITLNTNLLAYPPAAADYVVLHELCHFIHPNHSPAFHGFLAQFMPDWKERRALLRGAPVNGDGAVV